MSMNDVARLKDIDNLAQQTAGAIGNMPIFSFGALPVFSLGSSSAIVNGQAFYATLVAGEIASSTAGGNSTVDESGLLDCYLYWGASDLDTATKLVTETGNSGAVGGDLILCADAEFRTQIRYITEDDNPYIVSNPQSLPVSFMPWEVSGQSGVTFYVACGKKSGDFEFPATITVGVPAKDGYKSAQATITFSEE